MNDINIEIKEGSELTEEEINSINESKFREWKSLPLDDYQKKSIFVLLKNQQGKILAQGQLLRINGVSFRGENFNILGIGGIIANKKGEGYGNKLLEAIIQYAKDNKKSLLGFTGNDVIGFYQKCGFLVDYASLKRFVHLRNGKEIINTTEDMVFYSDSEDQFMKKVLTNSQELIYLPRDPDW